ncbi:MAG: hypothetical protein WKG07_35285 [Hymenobacter sp.]
MTRRFLILLPPFPPPPTLLPYPPRHAPLIDFLAGAAAAHAAGRTAAPAAGADFADIAAGRCENRLPRPGRAVREGHVLPLLHAGRNRD